jgi:hypothetical protein
VTFQAILNCAEDSFGHYDENRNVWMTIRSLCEDLLGAEDFWRYQELCDKDAFDYDCKENRLTDWKNLLDKFDPDDKDIGSSDYEGQSDLCDDIENKSKDMREKVIAYDQLKAFSLYLKDKANLSAAYHKFLVNIYSLLHDILLS